MFSTKFIALGAPVLVLAIAGLASAQTLIADYRLQDNYTSSVGSIGPLSVVGTPTDVTFTDGVMVDGQTQSVLNIATGSLSGDTGGGVQAQTKGFLTDPGNYSVVLLADFNISATDLVATKVMDFKNLSADDGLYINDATGVLEFNQVSNQIGSIPLVTTGVAPAVTAGIYTQIVLTRDSSTNLVSVYQDGAFDFSFTDTDGLATLGDVAGAMNPNADLTLFKDDSAGLGSTIVDETSFGDIARVRLYKGALPADQVADLDTVAVPEPVGVCLLMLGGMVMLGRNRCKS